MTITIRGSIIKPSELHRFLGVLVDEKLRWHKYIAYAIGRGTTYTLQLRRISLCEKGIPLTLARQLYTAVALPKMLYTLNMWFNPIYNEDTNIINRGSIGTSHQLAHVQCQAALFITGAFQTSATNVMKAHAKLLPIAQCTQTLCHCAALWIAAHPQSHPLHPLIRWAAK